MRSKRFANENLIKTNQFNIPTVAYVGVWMPRSIHTLHLKDHNCYIQIDIIF